MRIIFFGSSKYVIPIIEVLQKNFDLTLVVTTENPKDDLASQGEALQSYETYPVVKYCVENEVPFISVQQFNNLTIQQLKKLNAHVGILASFGAIIPNEVLNLFPHGIINIHPSLLPKYRGPTPVQTAILNGEKQTGITIIKLDSEIDHGPILTQEKEEILPLDSAESLYERLFKKGGKILPNIINKYLKGNLIPIAQNHKIAIFTNHLTRQDGFVDISKIKNQKSKIEIDRMIRAYYPWPGVWIKLKVKSDPFDKTQGHPERSRTDEKLKVIKFLPKNLIQVEGKKPMSYKDFINGYPTGKELLIKLGLLDKTK